MAYIGQSLVEGTRRVYNYTATSGQTTFNAVYQVGVVDVYKNGVLLTPSSYTSSNGQQIVLNSGASAGDTIAIHCHNTFSVTDTVPATGGAFSGAVTVQGAFTSLGIDDNADATAITIDSSERVGIGVAAPATTVHMKAASANLRIEDSDTSAYGQLGVDNAGSIYLQADNANAQSSTNMYFSLDNSEKMRISSAGNVGIGTASPTDTASFGKALDVSSSTGAAVYVRDAGGSKTGYFGQFNEQTSIVSRQDDGNIAFYTGASPSEKMRLDASGNLNIGSNTNVGFGPLQLGSTSSASTILQMIGSTSGNNTLHFGDATSGADRYKGYIQYAHGNDSLQFGVNAAERLRLDNAGHVLINNTAYGANGTLVVQQTADSKGIAIVDSAEANTFFLENDGTINKIRNNAAVPISFETNSAERMRLLADGTLVVGHTVAENRVAQPLAVTSAGARGGITVNSFYNSASGPLVDFQVSRNNTAGSHTAVSDGDALGTFIFRADDGDEFKDAAAIEANADHAVSNDNVSGRLVFYVAPQGSTGLVERMRLTGNGNVRQQVNAQGWVMYEHEGSGHPWYKCWRTFHSGSSAQTFDILRYRRYYWGSGNVKISVRQTYYVTVGEGIWYLEGHGRNDGSYSGSYSLHHHNINNTSSGLITLGTQSASSPGSSAAHYVDVKINIAAYHHYTVELDISHSEYYKSPTDAMNLNSFALH